MTAETPRHPRRPIARRVTNLLIAASAVSALAVLAVALSHQLNVSRSILANERDLISSSTVPVLSHLVWVVNEEQTIQLVTGLAQQNTITAARLEAEGMQPIAIRTDAFRGERDRLHSWPLIHLRDGQELRLGTLQVWMPTPINLPGQYAAMFLGMGLGIGAIMFIVGLFWLAVRRRVTGPMAQLAREIGELKGRIALPDRWHEQTELETTSETYQIRLAVGETMDSLARSLAEKQMLLREVHHRVKNNLQLVSSLLSLQQNSTSDPAGQAALEDSQNRVQSMALVHELLYQETAGEALPFDSYLRNLAGGLQPARGSGVRVQVDAVPASVGIEAAIPAGLVINELVTNAIKHAYPGEATGSVDVISREHPAEPQRLIVEIRDEGIGLPADWTAESSSSLGMRIADSLTRQLGSALEVSSSAAGSRFSFSVPRLPEVVDNRSDA